LISDFKV